MSTTPITAMPSLPAGVVPRSEFLRKPGTDRANLLIAKIRLQLQADQARRHALTSLPQASVRAPAPSQVARVQAAAAQSLWKPIAIFIGDVECRTGP